MDVAVEMRESIIELAGPREWHATRESWLAKAARESGISYRTAKSIFYEQHADHRASVVEKVRAAMARKQQTARDINGAAGDLFQQIKLAHEQLKMLQDKLAVLNKALDKSMGS